MIDRFSLKYKIIEKLLDFIKWYFDKQNYIFTYKYIWRPEQKERDKVEQSYREKYFKTKEGKKALAKTKRKIHLFIKKNRKKI